MALLGLGLLWTFRAQAWDWVRELLDIWRGEISGRDPHLSDPVYRRVKPRRPRGALVGPRLPGRRPPGPARWRLRERSSSGCPPADDQASGEVLTTSGRGLFRLSRRRRHSPPPRRRRSACRRRSPPSHWVSSATVRGAPARSRFRCVHPVRRNRREPRHSSGDLHVLARLHQRLDAGAEILGAFDEVVKCQQHALASLHGCNLVQQTGDGFV